MSGPSSTRDLGAAAVAVVIAVVAGLAIWQAREFSAFGSIFPFVIGGSLLAGSLLVLVRSLIGRKRTGRDDAAAAAAKDHGREGLLRSFALIAVLIVWVAALEWTGFLVTSWACFLALALVADAERPTLARTALYAGVAFAVVGGLQVLFQHALKVRLPAGELVTRLLG